MNFVFFLSLLRVNSESAIRSWISENISVMLNFSVVEAISKRVSSQSKNNFSLTKRVSFIERAVLRSR